MRFIFNCLLFFGLSMTFAHSNTEINITKSANDKRDYVYTELKNGLKLLVISDPEAQRAAAAVDVGVGSSSDPDDYLGLAHFLEHMLFLGTDQYPDPDDYINYISDHGGNHNAFTAFDHTNYFFDIDPAFLLEGLKRFSRFFVAPTMSEKYVQRERNAVNSEYQSKLREDGWRGMDVLKAVINPEHPYSRFNVGNLATLPKESVRPALLEFYNKYYSSDRMTAVIIGRESTDVLLKWGKTLFAEVPQRKNVEMIINEKLFDGIQLPMQVKSQSIKNEKNLSLYFQLPYRLDTEYSKSLSYLSYVLGYEGEGSLLEGLKQLDYASELYAGAGYQIGSETSFEIGLQLTERGYQNLNKVFTVIFSYLELLKNDENGEKRYQELATVAKTAFQFKEKTPSMNEVSGLSNRLNRFPAEDVQALNAIFSGYDKVEISDYLSQMTPNNTLVQITAPEFSSEKKTQYFDVPYLAQPLDSSSMTTLGELDLAIVEAMHLPNPNPFIAEDFSLHQAKNAESHVVRASGVELFFKHDTTFSVPKSSVHISLQPTIKLSIKDKTAMSLLAALLDEQLTKTLYDASVAGVNAEIESGEKSLAISLEGYQQKMPDLLTVILQQLKTVNVDHSTFTRVKDIYRQDLQNAAAKMPYQQTFSYLNYALVDDASLPEQRLSVLEEIDANVLKNFADTLLKSMSVRMMVYGNDTYETAVQLADSLPNILENTDLKHNWKPNKAKQLVRDVTQVVTVDHDDHAITYYIPGEMGHRARAEIGLLAKMLEPQFFTQLRTEKQLGYIVFAYPRPTYNQAGIAFTIQSPVANADELEQHIRNFNQQFSETLLSVKEENFNEVKLILKNELLQKPENLISAAGLYWSDILTTGKTVSSRQAIADEIDKVELKEFIKNMQSLLSSKQFVVIKAVPKK